MEDRINYTIGESVVNKNNMRMATVVDATDNDGETDSIKIQYLDDGNVEWVFSDKVTKLLLEVDPKPNNTNLNEDIWNSD